MSKQLEHHFAEGRAMLEFSTVLDKANLAH